MLLSSEHENSENECSSEEHLKEDRLRYSHSFAQISLNRNMMWGKSSQDARCSNCSGQLRSSSAFVLSKMKMIDRRTCAIQYITNLNGEMALMSKRAVDTAGLKTPPVTLDRTKIQHHVDNTKFLLELTERKATPKLITKSPSRLNSKITRGQ